MKQWVVGEAAFYNLGSGTQLRPQQGSAVPSVWACSLCFVHGTLPRLRSRGLIASRRHAGSAGCRAPDVAAASEPAPRCGFQASPWLPGLPVAARPPGDVAEGSHDATRSPTPRRW